ncbi:hypothetical protein M5E87_15605 [Flavonifractor plautii]|nr:hypothetical protein M5E87_15605 [Flavonifractor plautii]
MSRQNLKYKLKKFDL